MSPQSSRTDAELVDRMERDVDPESADEAAARVPYQRLIERIGSLDVVEPPPGWVERAVDRWERSTAAPPIKRRRRWVLAAAAVAIAVAIVAVMTLSRGGGGEPDRFRVAVTRLGAPRTDGAAVGDVLELHAPRRGRDAVELRVYRDRVLVARCPGDARCGVTERAIELAWRLDVPGAYHAIAITSDAPLPTRPSRGLELDLLDLPTGARIDRPDPIDVR